MPRTPAVKQPGKQQKLRGRPFKPGQSGNPNGRPKNEQCLTALLRKEIETMCPADKEGRTWAQLMVLATMRLAMAGNATALKEVWDRLDGKVTTPIDLDSPAEGIPLIKVVFIRPEGERSVPEDLGLASPRNGL